MSAPLVLATQFICMRRVAGEAWDPGMGGMSGIMGLPAQGRICTGTPVGTTHWDPRRVGPPSAGALGTVVAGIGRAPGMGTGSTKGMGTGGTAWALQVGRIGRQTTGGTAGARQSPTSAGCRASGVTA
jgi:hypothetical protein